MGARTSAAVADHPTGYYVLLHALVLFPDEVNLRQLTLARDGDWNLEAGATYRFEVAIVTEQVNGPVRPVTKTKVRALRAASVAKDA